MAEGREASAKKRERDARAKTQRQLLARLNAPQPSQADLEGPAAERERLAESATEHCIASRISANNWPYSRSALGNGRCTKSASIRETGSNPG